MRSRYVPDTTVPLRTVLSWHGVASDAMLPNQDWL
jgi:hypothetical protein